MKTTIDISDAILVDAKKLARKEGSTIRALVEEGLRRVVEERTSRKPFRLRRASVRGKGLQPHVKEGDWDHIRSMVYEGRGA